MTVAVFRIWLIAAVVLAGMSIVEVVRSLRDDRTDLASLLDADTLGPAAVYQDVFVDGYRLDHYQFSAATFAVPDLAVYFLVRAAVGRTGPAVLAWPWALFAVVVLAGSASAALVTPPASRRNLAPILIGWVAAYVAFTSLWFFQQPANLLHQPVYHSGSLALGLLGLCLALKFLGSRTRFGGAGWLAGLGAVCAAAMFSDRLFGFYFAAPFGVAIIGAYLARPVGGALSALTRTRAAALLATAGAGCWAGLFVLRRSQGPEDPLVMYWAGPLWNGIGSRAEELFGILGRQLRNGNLLVGMATAWYVMCAVDAVKAIVRRNGLTPFAFYQFFSTATLVAVIGAFLVSRTSADGLARGNWNDFSRYFVGPIGLAFFGWPVRLALIATGTVWKPLRVGAALTPMVLGGMAVGANWVEPKYHANDLSDPRPEFVRQVDEARERYGVRDGLGPYWVAKPISLLSRTGVRVRQVAPAEGTPFGVKVHFWLSNAEWYWKSPDGGDVSYRFVLTVDHPPYLLTDLPTDDMIQVLGEPSARAPVGRFTMLVYDRPADARFHDYHDLDPMVLNLRHQLNPRSPLHIPAGALEKIGGPLVGRDGGVVASAGKHPAGVIANGPGIRPLTGSYRATFQIRSTGTPISNGRVAVLYVPPDGQAEEMLTSQDVPPESDANVPVTFEVSKRMRAGKLMFQVQYRGQGTLAFRSVEIQLCQ